MPALGPSHTQTPPTHAHTPTLSHTPLPCPPAPPSRPQSGIYPSGIYVPAILPLIIVFCITSIETVGDVAATEEASFLPTTGEKHDRRIRGALLNDGACRRWSVRVLLGGRAAASQG